MGKVSESQNGLLVWVELGKHLAQQTDLAFELRCIFPHAVGDIWSKVFSTNQLGCLVGGNFEILGSVAVVIPHLSNSNREKPGLKACTYPRFIPMQVLECLEKRLTCQVLGKFRIPGAVIHKPKNGLVVRVVQPPERFRV